jgi:glucuronate isomerase
LRGFAERYHLFRGTPTRMWLDHALESLFGLGERLSGIKADACYDAIDAALKTDEFLPRALFERFNIATLATTESPLDALKLGPAWWFFDSPDGMMRFRELTTETAGFYNTVGFNDDTRAFLSIPARHDVARRVDCAYLANLVATHRLNETEAHEVAHDLAYALAKRAYKL